MTYPTQQEYERALRKPELSLRAPQLAGAQLVPAKNNGILRFSGGHFFVFVVDVGGQRTVIRCFSHPIPEAREQIPLIVDYLNRTRLPYFVRTEYVHEAIDVQGQVLPLILMDYAPGVHLGKFVEANLGAPNVLKALVKAWSTMMKQLHEKKVAHGDLQHKNILATWDGSSVALRLVDYETVVIPALDKQPLPGGGISAFQHPNAHSIVERSSALDHFPALVIATSLTAIAEKPALWTELNADSDSGLLFQASDFTSPASSPVFAALKALGGTAAHLALALEQACLNEDPLALPPLHDVEASGANASRPNGSTWWKPKSKNGTSQPTPTPPVVTPVNPVRNTNAVQATPTPSPVHAPVGNHQGTPKPGWVQKNRRRNQPQPKGGLRPAPVQTVVPVGDKRWLDGKRTVKPPTNHRPNPPRPPPLPPPIPPKVISVDPGPWTPPPGAVESRAQNAMTNPTSKSHRILANPPPPGPLLPVQRPDIPIVIVVPVFLVMLLLLVVAILVAVNK